MSQNNFEQVVLSNTIFQFAQCGKAIDAQNFLEEHLELLSDEAEREFDSIIDTLHNEKEQKIEELLISDKALIQECRAKGIKVAFFDRAITTLFFQIKAWDEKQSFLEYNQEILLSEEAERRLSEWIASYETKEGDEKEMYYMMVSYRSLLQRCRQIGIAAAFAEVRKASDSENILPIIEQFIHTNDWEEKQAILVKHPELLTDDALERLDGIAKNQTLEHGRTVVEAHRNLLILCRETGISAAFRETSEHDFPNDQQDDTNIMQLIVEFIRTIDKNQKCRILKQNPELLSDYADEILSHLIHVQKNEESRKVFESTRAIFQDCRERGIDACFSYPLEVVIQGFIDADTWVDRKLILEHAPELLTEQANSLFLQLIEMQQDEWARKMLEYFHYVLTHHHSNGFELILTVDKFTAAEDWDTKQQIVKQYPELLTDETNELLSRFAMIQRDEQTRSVVELNHHVLKRCKEVGIEAAFIETNTFIGDNPDPLKQVVLNFMSADDWHKKQQLIEQHPKLLTEEADSILSKFQEGEQLQRVTDVHRAFLNICRQAGHSHIMQLIDNFINCKTWDERQEMLQGHPEFLTHDFDIFFSFLIEMQTDSKAQYYMNVCRTVLQQCRTRGIDEVANLLDDETSHPILEKELQVEEAMQRYKKHGDVNALDDCIAIYEDLLKDDRLPKCSRAIQLKIIENAVESFRRRFHVKQQLSDIDRAIELCYQVLYSIPLEDFSCSLWQYMLSQRLLDRYLQTSALEELRQSLESCQKAIDLAPKDHIYLNRFYNGFGRSLYSLYRHTGTLEHLKQSTEAHRFAVKLTPEDSSELAMYLKNLGQSLRHVYRWTKELSILQEGISLLKKSVEISPPENVSFGHDMYLSELGGGLFDLYKETEEIATLDEAISVFRKSVEIMPNNAPTPLNGLAATLMTHYMKTKERAELDEAITIYREIITSNLSHPNISEYLNNFASALRIRHGLLGQNSDFEEAKEMYLQACEKGIKVSLDDTLISSRNWGNWAMEREAWEEAVQASRYGLLAAHRLYRYQSDYQDKEKWLDKMQQFHVKAAYAAVKSGQLCEAVIALESGRAFLISEQLARRQKRCPWGLPTFSDIVSKDVILVYIVPMLHYTSFALIVYPDETITLLWLDRLTEQDVQEKLLRLDDNKALDGYVGAYVHWRENQEDKSARESWFMALDSTTRWIWDILMEPIVEHLMEEEYAVALIPYGGLNFIPLHAAWTENSNRYRAYFPSNSRFYAFDAIHITYAPNARTLSISDIEEPITTNNLFAINNPDNSLRFSDTEISIASVYFEETKIVNSETATLDSVKNLFPNYSVLHISTHGRAGWIESLSNFLVLANDEYLTFPEIFSLDLDNVRLAILSACETNVSGLKNPDEVINIPTGLIQAGVQGVIASLWAVNEASTMMIISRFYEIWRGEGESPSKALRQAQIWVRDTSIEKKLLHFQKNGHLSKSLERELKLAKSDEYSHPFYWAGFGFTGR